MNLRALRTLAKLQEVESFVAVAADTNQTLSAVSMQMKGLENTLRADLFDRSFRPPKLTPLGREVARWAEEMVRCQDAMMGLAVPGQGLRGRYRIGFILTASVRILPGFLAACREKAPQAQFEVETGLSEQLQDRVLRGLLDAAVITRAERDPDGLAFRPLTREEIVLALPRAFAEKPAEEISRQLPFFQFMPGTGIGQLIAGGALTCRIPPERRITMDGIEATVECVRRGLGYTALPRADILRYAGEDVVLLPFAETPLMREIALVTLRGTATERAAETLKDLLSG